MKKIVYVLLGLIVLLLLLALVGCKKQEKKEVETSLVIMPPEITQTTESRQFIIGGVAKGYVCEVQINNHDFFCVYTHSTYASIDLTHNPDCKKCKP